MSDQHSVTLVNITDGTVHGHKAGCADLKRGNLRKHAEGKFTLEVESKAVAWETYNADFIPEAIADGMPVESSAYEIEWAPCANHVPEGDREAIIAAYMPEQEQTEPEGWANLTGDQRAQALRNFADLAKSAPSEAARNYWQQHADALA